MASADWQVGDGDDAAGGEPSALDHYYATLEKSVSLVRDTALAQLVVANGNHGLPVHRWFRVKEAYSADLLGYALDLVDAQRKRYVVADPFLGSGTTATSGVLGHGVGSRRIHVAGVECNPFLHLLAAAKAHAADVDSQAFRTAAAAAMRAVSRGTVEAAPVPGLSTFHNSAYFRPDVLLQLLELRAAVDRSPAEPAVRRLLQVCLAGCVEPASTLRRDGRALRHESLKVPVGPLGEFQRRAKMIADDLRGLTAHGRAAVHLGDARECERLLGEVRGSVDLALFSPPYPNCIDYTEIYKTEAWLLGLYTGQEAFLNQRRTTIRSHPSIGIAEDLLCGPELQPRLDDVLEPVLRGVPAGPDQNWRRRLVRGYFDDMLVTLRACRGLLRDGGFVACVVGNSLHGRGSQRFLIASDLLIGALAQAVNLRLIEIRVARHPVRTTAALPLLRESLVLLQAV